MYRPKIANKDQTLFPIGYIKTMNKTLQTNYIQFYIPERKDKFAADSESHYSLTP